MQKFFLVLVVNMVTIFLILALCEGLSSLVLLWRSLTNSPVVAERAHTQYDAELGWVNLPQLFIEDMYGPGLHLQTNARGFRNDQEFSVTIPPNKVRAICSGDSFTLGYGVANEQTWCHLLAASDSRLQTVNMGQGGYGIGQSYLWYERDGAKLDHDIHLFAFITTDFERMQRTEFLGYGKPRLVMQGRKLVIENVPVPERAFYTPWLTQNGEALGQLRSVQLVSGFFFDQAAQTSETPTLALIPDQNSSPPEKVATEILKDLLRLNEAKGSILILIYLPTLGDHEIFEQSSTDRWRSFLNVAAQDTNVIFVDLIEEFRKLPPEELQSLFIPEDTLDFPAAAGHYSAQGNAYIAGVLYKKLLAQPVVSSRLAKIGP